ncbi:MAG: microcin C ABC transporter permease YejB [Proteobacteria bacterium]|nr:microcin C ABC transporter permease YejB [Pseudomonadota bacterium]MDA1331111.1 microcin C ABC transporter permease YejB [Pseudomonadota bacterium]
MTPYIFRRLLLIIPTLLGIMLTNFLVIQAAPGGPVEQAIAQLSGHSNAITEKVTKTSSQETLNNAASSSKVGNSSSTPYRGAQGLDPEFIKELEVRFGFDKPLHERFLKMMSDYLVFDFGKSFYRDTDVVDLVLQKLPVSISLGLWTTLIVYLISIPLGIRKAVADGSQFDMITSFAIIIGTAIPSFLFAVFMMVIFAGGSYLDWFPLRGLQSEEFLGTGVFECAVNFSCMKDYIWHLALPIISMVIGGFAGLTMLTKNSFIDQIHQQYVMTARAKGLTEKRVLYGHVFRNAMLIVIAGFPSALVSILFTGSLLIEIIFSLDGLGLLGFEAAFSRDYPLMFGSLFFFSLLGLVMNLIGDIMYMVIDPRIDFEGQS